MKDKTYSMTVMSRMELGLVWLIATIAVAGGCQFGLPVFIGFGASLHVMFLASAIEAAIANRNSP